MPSPLSGGLVGKVPESMPVTVGLAAMPGTAQLGASTVTLELGATPGEGQLGAPTVTVALCISAVSTRFEPLASLLN